MHTIYLKTEDKLIIDILKETYNISILNTIIIIKEIDLIEFEDYLDNIMMDYTLNYQLLIINNLTIDDIIINDFFTQNKLTKSYNHDYLYHCLVFYPSSNSFNNLTNQVISLDHDLLLCLKTYVINNGNTMKSAKDLFLHRNTMMYRLNKLESILNIDLHAPLTLHLLMYIIYLTKR